MRSCLRTCWSSNPALVRTIAAVWVLCGALYIVWCLCGRPVVRVGGREVTPPKIRHGLVQFCVGILEWVFTSAVLYLVLPPDFGMPYWHFVAVYVLAYMAGYISHVPGGLGVFETVLLVLMPETVPTHVVAAGIITYRVIYFLMPLAWPSPSSAPTKPPRAASRERGRGRARRLAIRGGGP